MRGIIGLALIGAGLLLGFTIITGFNPVSTITQTITQPGQGAHHPEQATCPPGQQMVNGKCVPIGTQGGP